jgi:hypothetical protein
LSDVPQISTSQLAANNVRIRSRERNDGVGVNVDSRSYRREVVDENWDRRGSRDIAEELRNGWLPHRAGCRREHKSTKGVTVLSQTFWRMQATDFNSTVVKSLTPITRTQNKSKVCSRFFCLITQLKCLPSALRAAARDDDRIVLSVLLQDR